MMAAIMTSSKKGIFHSLKEIKKTKRIRVTVWCVVCTDLRLAQETGTGFKFLLIDQLTPQHERSL